MTYFKDSRGEWHQPGSECEFDDAEAKRLETDGHIKTIRTESVEAPESRVIQYQQRRARR
jgi:hypothetical protein